MNARQARKRRQQERRQQQAKRQRELERRRRRGFVLTGLSALVGVVVVLAIAASEAGKSKPADLSYLQGIPQQANVLGRDDAPLTLVEFIDLQCPYCAEASKSLLPPIIQRYVRSGKVKLRVEPLTFLGAGSDTAARTAFAAGRQQKMFEFIAQFFAHQKAENSGYVTDQFVREIAQLVPGLDVEQMMRERDSNAALAFIDRSARIAQEHDVSATPTFLLGPDEGSLKKLEVVDFDPEKLASQIDEALARHGG